ncbi:MAG: YbjQ family protein [Porticoccaceae bacterium]|nr:YbjQ family protein [Porticoccaceae bacterium]
MIDIIVFITLLALGYGFGRMAESKHFKSIIEREKQFLSLLTFSERMPPANITSVDTVLVGGNVVISVDYFKRFIAGLRGIIGGRITSYESLLERARREAMLRMKEDAQSQGANMIVNVKLETASITKGKKQQVGAVEVYAYGTALVPIPTV